MVADLIPINIGHGRVACRELASSVERVPKKFFPYLILIVGGESGTCHCTGLRAKLSKKLPCHVAGATVGEPEQKRLKDLTSGRYHTGRRSLLESGCCIYKSPYLRDS